MSESEVKFTIKYLVGHKVKFYKSNKANIFKCGKFGFQMKENTFEGIDIVPEGVTFEVPIVCNVIDYYEYMKDSSMMGQSNAYAMQLNLQSAKITEYIGFQSFDTDITVAIIKKEKGLYSIEYPPFDMEKHEARVKLAKDLLE